MELDVVNIAEFLSAPAEGRRDCAERLVRGLEAQGMVLLEGHGMTCSEMETALQHAHTLFDLDLQQKLAITLTREVCTRGYIPAGHESGSQRAEAKEGFSFGHELDPHAVGDRGLRAPNMWPAALDAGARNGMGAAYVALCRVCHTVTAMLDLALRREEDAFASICRTSDEVSLLRCFHYSGRRPGVELGSSPHTDWGFLTLILPEPGKPGLELWYAGQWWPVSCPRGALVLNGGDFLSVLTQGRLVSPLHRVILGEEERISFVLFFYPDADTAVPTARDVAHSDLLVRLSIFQDQTEAHSTSSEPRPNTFGDLMLSKWRQVSRKAP